MRACGRGVVQFVNVEAKGESMVNDLKLVTLHSQWGDMMETTRLTDFTTLFEHYYSNFPSLLLLELLQADSSTEPSRASTDNAYIYIVRGTLDRVWIGLFVSNIG